MQQSDPMDEITFGEIADMFCDKIDREAEKMADTINRKIDDLTKDDTIKRAGDFIRENKAQVAMVGIEIATLAMHLGRTKKGK